jgi:flavin reductase (DIM6/NTAB) family NADH-FMN oxidoreductase RutF
MFYEPAMNNHGLPHDPFKAIVAPRPIGWISSVNSAGVVNLAPYSFFNAFGTDPHIVGFSSGGHKDSLTNVEQTGEFVCSFVTYDLRDVMNETSASLPHGISEMESANILSAPSRMVRPPRVAASPAALECRWTRTVPLEGHDGRKASYFLVLGEVVGVYVDDRFIREGRFDAGAAHPISRGGYHDYHHGNDLFQLARPKSAPSGH